jgi:16S rRNA (cytosine1402-N4)-methyltransferase
VFDLGVSSYQLDTPGKGFTYREKSAPLDMRFDQTTGETAADVITTATEEDLYEVFAKFGEEELAGTIAHALYRARVLKPMITVGDIDGVVRTVVRDKRHANSVLSRIFQALRIVTNEELQALTEGLEGARKAMRPGGRLAVISFHSLEDRITKLFLQSSAWRRISKKPIVASRAEQEENRRSRSAKLRIAEKV